MSLVREYGIQCGRCNNYRHLGECPRIGPRRVAAQIGWSFIREKYTRADGYRTSRIIDLCDECTATKEPNDQ